MNCSVFANGNGALTYQDVLRAFKAIPMQRQAAAGGAAADPYRSSGGAASASGSYGAAGAAVNRDYEWKLVDVFDGQGRKYLLDEETKVRRGGPCNACNIPCCAAPEPCLHLQLDFRVHADSTSAHLCRLSSMRRSAPASGHVCMAAWTHVGRQVKLHPFTPWQQASRSWF